MARTGVESLTWGDLDTGESRWRVARQREKGRRGRWVPVPSEVFAAVDDLLPREDRDLEGRVFGWLAQANLRREIGRPVAGSSTASMRPPAAVTNSPLMRSDVGYDARASARSGSPATA